MDRNDFIEEMKDKDEQELLEIWYDSYHKKTFGIGFHEAAGTAPNLKEAFKHWCADTSLHEKVCVGWDYCQKKRSLGRSLQLATVLGDVLSPLFGLSTNGAFSAALLMVEHGFDFVCDCDEAAPASPPTPAP